MSRPLSGSLRVLPSGRVQVRYTGPDGLRRTAPQTFSSKTLARRWLSLVEADMVRGVWRDPTAVLETLSDYATRWLRERSGLSDRTRELYGGLLKRQILPGLGDRPLDRITPGLVRSWRQDLIEVGTGPSTVAKSYRLLRGILATAVEDELLPRNPARIKGAGVEVTPERSVLSLAEVGRVAEVIDRRYRLLVLLAVFGSMRWGELMGLRRSDLDLTSAEVKIERAVVEVASGLVVKPPKTAAGLRTVALPRWLVPEIVSHLAEFAEVGPNGRVFIGPHGATPSRRNFVTIWTRTKRAAEIDPTFHFHDLRHTGNHLAASTGASTRELMGRMGHASMRAALIYQHRTAERDRAIADAMDALLSGSPDGRLDAAEQGQTSADDRD